MANHAPDRCDKVTRRLNNDVEGSGESSFRSHSPDGSEKVTRGLNIDKEGSGGKQLWKPLSRQK